MAVNLRIEARKAAASGAFTGTAWFRGGSWNGFIFGRMLVRQLTTTGRPWRYGRKSVRRARRAIVRAAAEIGKAMK